MENHELGRFRIKTEGDDRAARAIKKPDNKETHFCNLSKVVLAHGSLKVFYSHLKKTLRYSANTTLHTLSFSCSQNKALDRQIDRYISHLKKIGIRATGCRRRYGVKNDAKWQKTTYNYQNKHKIKHLISKDNFLVPSI